MNENLFFNKITFFLFIIRSLSHIFTRSKRLELHVLKKKKQVMVGDETSNKVLFTRFRKCLMSFPKRVH